VEHSLPMSWLGHFSTATAICISRPMFRPPVAQLIWSADVGFYSRIGRD
jgi:hypothetical protein